MKVKFTYYPISEAIKAPDREGLFCVYKNRYWKVDKDCIMFYDGTSPQCNSNEQIMSRYDSKFEVRFIETIYIPFKETNEGCEPDPTVHL
jgi:hypothetical protein